MTFNSQLYSKLRFYLVEPKGHFYDFYHFTLLFLNARNVFFFHFKSCLSQAFSFVKTFWVTLLLPCNTYRCHLFLIAIVYLRTAPNTFHCLELEYRGENINATLQRIVWISSAIMRSVMTRSIRIRME